MRSLRQPLLQPFVLLLWCPVPLASLSLCSPRMLLGHMHAPGACKCCNLLARRNLACSPCLLPVLPRSLLHSALGVPATIPLQPSPGASPAGPPSAYGLSRGCIYRVSVHVHVPLLFMRPYCLGSHGYNQMPGTLSAIPTLCGPKTCLP